MKGISLEARVGGLVLVAGAVALGFLAVLGNVQLESGIRVHVDYAYGGALQPGAHVQVGGLRVGRVVELELLHPQVQPSAAQAVEDLGQRDTPIVRATLDLDREVASHLRQGTGFAVATHGLIGETYVEMIPAPASQPALALEQAVRGVDAPRLHVMMLQVSQLVDMMGALFGGDEAEAAGGEALARSGAASTGRALRRLLESLGNVVEGREESLGRGLDDAVAAVADLRGVAAQVRGMLEHDGRLNRMLSDGQEVVAQLHGRMPALLKDLDSSLKSLRRMSGNAEEALDAETFQALVKSTQNTVADLEEMTAQAKGLLAQVERGQGTLGGVLTDPQIYDDLKDLLRDLKQHPWKMLWRD